MQKLTIDNLGPISHAELNVDDFMVFTGPQASGKSTIAKAIYFFRTIKDEVYSHIVKSSALTYSISSRLDHLLGDAWIGRNPTSIEYSYSNDANLSVNKSGILFNKHGGLLADFFSGKLVQLSKRSTPFSEDEKAALKSELDDLFSDPYETIIIPAGRSMVTLLASQWNYLYSIMDDAQKRTIDYCTRSYLEQILKIRPQFNDGLRAMVWNELPQKKKGMLDFAISRIERIIKGDYKYGGGREGLELPGNQYVGVNYMSSGQQEVLWILNLLFYQLLYDRKTYFIIEEPESNLFPEAQAAITEFISFVRNEGNGVLLTTHSPYVLGSLNNSLYAGNLAKTSGEAVEKVVDKSCWIDRETFSAWYFDKGKPNDCMDKELNIIDNSVIDGISAEINDRFDKLMDIELGNEGAGE